MSVSRRPNRPPSHATPPRSLAGARRPALALGAAVVLLAVLPYLDALSGGFTLDDIPVVVENPLLQRPLDLGRIFTSNLWGERETAPPAPGAGQNAAELKGLYRPVTVLSFALERALWGSNPRGYHAVNVALHALVSWLVFRIALAVLASPLAAFAAAGLFAVHPVHTEAVTSVVGLAELLAAIFFLLALLLGFSRWMGRARGQGRAALGVVSLFFVGLCSKEIVVTLPGILVACAALVRPMAPGRRREADQGGHGERGGRRKPGASPQVAPEGSAAARPWLGKRVQGGWAGWAVLLAGLALALWAFLLLRGGALKPTKLMWVGFHGVTAEQRLLTASRVLMEYLGLLVWPGTLSAEYALPQVPIARSALEPPVLASLVLWPALAAAAILSRRRSRAIALGLVWFFLTILPVANVVLTIGVAKAERLLYLPSVGFCLVVGAFVMMARDRVRGAWPVLLALLPVLAAFSVRTWVRNQDWRDNFTLALATLRTSPTSPIFNRILGVEYRRRGEYARAQPYLETALREARPEYSGDSYNLGNNLLSLGNYDEAERMFRRALELRPDWSDAMNNLGQVQMLTGRNAEAVRTLTRILELDRSYLGAYNNLGTAYLDLGDAQGAARVFREGLTVAPANAQLHFNLAVALKALGQTAEALRERERAVALDSEAAKWEF